MEIRSFQESDEDEVVELWERCALTRAWNDPRRDIARKLRVQRELFLVGVLEARLVATAMAGYDGHRGWVNYLAVDPRVQRRGLGRTLMGEVERRLETLGCPKINLQIRHGNGAVLSFYAALGYAEDAVLSLGKRLDHDR